MTTLHWATCVGHKDIVELLRCAGVNITANDQHGPTALHPAAHNRQMDMVKLLLLWGAEIAAKDLKGSTALHLATGKGHRDVVELLLSRGRDVDAKDVDEETPLYQAAKKGQKDVVELLLSHGIGEIFLTMSITPLADPILYVAQKYAVLLCFFGVPISEAGISTIYRNSPSCPFFHRVKCPPITPRTTSVDDQVCSESTEISMSVNAIEIKSHSFESVLTRSLTVILFKNMGILLTLDPGACCGEPLCHLSSVPARKTPSFCQSANQLTSELGLHPVRKASSNLEL